MAITTFIFAEFVRFTATIIVENKFPSLFVDLHFLKVIVVDFIVTKITNFKQFIVIKEFKYFKDFIIVIIILSFIIIKLKIN